MLKEKKLNVGVKEESFVILEYCLKKGEKGRLSFNATALFLHFGLFTFISFFSMQVIRTTYHLYSKQGHIDFWFRRKSNSAELSSNLPVASTVFPCLLFLSLILGGLIFMAKMSSHAGSCAQNLLASKSVFCHFSCLSLALALLFWWNTMKILCFVVALAVKCDVVNAFLCFVQS